MFGAVPRLDPLRPVVRHLSEEARWCIRFNQDLWHHMHLKTAFHQPHPLLDIVCVENGIMFTADSLESESVP